MDQIDMELPPILVINLPERKDRWISLENQLRPTGLKYERVDAVRRKPGWKGCSLSHRRCIEIAQQRGWPWVLILEDDCLLKPGWNKQFQTILPTLWNTRSEWEIFNGGPSYLKEVQIISLEPPMFSIKAYAAQFMLTHQGTYDKILRDVGDHLKIDVYYAENMKAWCSYPHLATQQNSYSDIVGEKIDYTKIFNKSEHRLFSIMNEVEHQPAQKIVSGFIIASLLLFLATRFRK